MRQKLDLILAERRGSRIAREFGFDALPVEPRRIAEARGIVIGARPLENFSGCLIRHGDQFGIVYGENLANAGMINFTIAHELGHYFLDGHAEALFPTGAGMHQSTGPFRSADPREREADHFAVGLLMPEQLFIRAARDLEHGIAAVESLASICVTSMTATAIRYARLSEDPVAMIVATHGTVEFCFASTPLVEHHGIEWVRKGTIVPAGTVTRKLSEDPAAVESASRLRGGCSFSDWFDGGPEIDCWEECVGLGRFDQTLTILWSEEAIAEGEDGDS